MQRGRKSAAALAVAPSVAIDKRLLPPKGMEGEQKALWLATVNAKPASWFGVEHGPMLEAYVRHVATAGELTKQIEACDLSSRDPHGLIRLDRLSRMRCRESAAIIDTARAMRLTQHSIIRADRAEASTPTPGGPKPWH